MQTKFLSPSDIVQQIHLSAGLKIADFGSGAGDFAVSLAKIVGSNGVVYAIDILESSLQSLRSKSKMQSLLNIELIRADLEEDHGSKLPDQSVDLVLVHNVLFQVKDKIHLLKEASRVSKSDGRMLCIEWDMVSPIGPPRHSRISEKDLINVCQSIGFHFERKINAGKYHYGLIFKV